MLIAHSNVYADFLAAIKELKPLHVFYSINSAGALGVQVHVENKNLICGFFATTPPATFNADFPQAILMADLPYLNQGTGQQY